MSCRPVARLLAAVLVAAMAVGGCSSQIAGTATAGGPVSKEPVAWIDAVCGGLVPVLETVTKEPTLDENDLVAAKQATSAYLATVLDGLDRGLPIVDSAGPSPIEGGDQLATKVKTTMTKLKTDLAAQKVKLDAVDPADRLAVGLLFIEIGTTLQNVGKNNPLADLNTNQRLRSAASQSVNCRKVI